MNPPPPREDATLGPTMVSIGSGAGMELLCKRFDVKASRAKEALLNKASVEIKQITPFCMEIIVGKQDRYPLFYPVPIDGSRSKLRIARKSSYVEVSRSILLNKRLYDSRSLRLSYLLVILLSHKQLCSHFQ
jgi:hypothetical protein